MSYCSQTTQTMECPSSPDRLRQGSPGHPLFVCNLREIIFQFLERSFFSTDSPFSLDSFFVLLSFYSHFRLVSSPPSPPISLPLFLPFYFFPFLPKYSTFRVLQTQYSLLSPNTILSAVSSLFSPIPACHAYDDRV